MSPDKSPRQTQSEERRRLLVDAKRLVVKIGTNVLTRAGGEVAVGRIHSLIEEIVDLHRAGREPIIVSSGAISMGMEQLGFTSKPAFLPDKQACAAVGQTRLMSVYEQAFQRYGITTGQMLLTEDDFSNRVRYLNLRNTMGRLLERRVVPIVNENDSVSTSEIELQQTIFGDNDQLSALVATKLEADVLLLLTDVDGLLPLGEGPAPSAVEPLRRIEEITPEIEAMAQVSSGPGRGGMLSKLRSIRAALDGGVAAVIANGKRPGILEELLSGQEVGTLFLSKRRFSSRKSWLAHATNPVARVWVNDGAYAALSERQTSLLLAGVTKIEDECRRGDVVSIVDGSGREFARGIVNYGSTEARPHIGKRSEEIRASAQKDYEEFVTRDNLVLR